MAIAILRMSGGACGAGRRRSRRDKAQPARVTGGTERPANMRGQDL